MNVYRLAASVTVRAPAKLNLFFEVLGKRSDGFHEIETLMIPVTLFDTLTATADPSGLVSVDCQWVSGVSDAQQSLGELPAERDNLATQAIELLRRRSGVEVGITVTLIKRIPAAAGLGGGSSDGAAALLAANAVWNLNWPTAKLAQLAAELGSDVPFFLSSGAAVCRGRGEQVEPVQGLAPLHIVVVRPAAGLSTAKVFANCRVPEAPRAAAPLIAALRRGDERQVPELIHNRLEEAAAPLSPWVERLRWEFSEQDCLAAQMSGSGTSYFGVCRHARHAQRVARRLRSRGVGHVFAVSTSN